MPRPDVQFMSPYVRTRRRRLQSSRSLTRSASAAHNDDTMIHVTRDDSYMHVPSTQCLLATAVLVGSVALWLPQPFAEISRVGRRQPQAGEVDAPMLSPLRSRCRRGGCNVVGVRVLVTRAAARWSRSRLCTSQMHSARTCTNGWERNDRVGPRRVQRPRDQRGHIGCALLLAREMTRTYASGRRRGRFGAGARFWDSQPPGPWLTPSMCV